MPRSLFIPTIGDLLVLAEDWSFPLHEEYRNNKFAVDNFKFGSEYARRWYSYSEIPARSDTVTLPAGTHLKIARIYIRGGGEHMKDFDSLTFTCNGHLKGKAAKGAIKGRFWAKLADVNRIVFE